MTSLPDGPSRLPRCQVRSFTTSLLPFDAQKFLSTLVTSAYVVLTSLLTLRRITLVGLSVSPPSFLTLVPLDAWLTQDLY